MKIKCIRNDSDSFLEIGKEYELEHAWIGGYCTDYKLLGVDKKVNSVQFANSIWDVPEYLTTHTYRKKITTK
jgi:hypothetical protein